MARARGLWSFRMAGRFLRGGRARFAMTILAVAIGVALVAAVDLSSRTVERAFVEVIDTMAGRAALFVSASGGTVPEHLRGALEAVPGVARAVPVVSASAFLDDGQVLTVHGVDLADETAVRLYEPAGDADDRPDDPLDDPLAFLNQPDSVLLTQALAARRRLAVGDVIALETPHGVRRLTVRGLLAPRGLARVEGGNIAVMDIMAAQLLFTPPGSVHRFDLVVEPEADLEQVRTAVAARLPDGLTVAAPAQRKLDLNRVMQSSRAVLAGVSLLGVFAAFLLAYGRLSSVFEGRAWEHAVLRATGISTPRVWWELTKEGVLVALAGVAIGLPLGTLAAWLMLPMIATTTALSAKLVAPGAELELRSASLLLAATTGVLAVLCAAAMPAWRAARVPIVRTLQGRHAEVRPRRERARQVALTAILLAFGAVAVLGDVAGSPHLGGLMTLLAVVAAALAAAPVLAFVARRCAAYGGPILRLSAATLLGAPRRSALAAATIAIGFGAVVWLWTIASSFQQSVLTLLPGKLRGDLSVTSAHSLGFVEAPVSEHLLDELRGVAGVEAVIGEQSTDGVYDGGPIALDAFDPRYFTDPRFGRWLLSASSRPDALEVVARGEAVIVSENFVHNLGLGPGDTLTLPTPSGAVRLPIAGVVVDFLSPRGTVNLSRELYARLWRDDRIVRALVIVGAGTDASEVGRRITASLGPRRRLRVLTIPALMAWFAEQVGRAFAALYALAGLVLVIVVAGVGDALAAGVVERTRELGTARALGASRVTLTRLVLTEALLVASVGLALAWSVGLALGALWVSSVFPALVGWTLRLDVPLAALLAIGAGALATCALAAWTPARSAARIEPARALRAE